ncbi:hypothetical protein GCM10020370_65410 [Paenibacillus hodogayensis]
MSECPKCNGREFGKGVQIGHGNVRPENLSLFNSGSELVHLFCLQCGFVVESYLKNPEKFKPKK